jgi:hypothetical protein
MLFLKNIFTDLLKIHSIFLTYFYFFKYFKYVNSKIIDFKIRWVPNPPNLLSLAAQGFSQPTVS